MERRQLVGKDRKRWLNKFRPPTRGIYPFFPAVTLHGRPKPLPRHHIAFGHLNALQVPEKISNKKQLEHLWVFHQNFMPTYLSLSANDIRL
jgi:hypothetical protein